MKTESDKPPYLEIGLYRHFKGGMYEVEGVALDKGDDDNRWLVIYHSLGDVATRYVRPYDQFIETVVVDGIKKPRFEAATNRLI